MTPFPWHEWLQKMNQGDEQAFQLIYDKSKYQVLRTVALLINNQQDIADVTSEIYSELFKTAGSFDGTRSFEAWLNGLIVRQTHNWNRRLWRKWRLFERSKLLDMSDRAPASEDLYLRNELYQELLKQVHTLSYKFRSVIVLRYYQDCTFEEISELLDIPEGTAKSRHRLALQKLRKLMGSSAEEILFPKETVAHVHSE